MEIVKNSVTVSVLICVRNTERYIANCIASILEQTYADFEIVIIEEFDSNDKTKEIIARFNDKRIRYFKNTKKLGLSKSRNLSVIHARGEYIFFTDGDCIVSKNWLEEGVKLLKDKGCIGVEGKSFYVSENYEPTFSEKRYTKMGDGTFMTNNIAYNKNVVKKIGGFDERYSFHEDRDLALRGLRIGKIRFNPRMKVFVQQQTLTFKDLIRGSEALRNKVFLFKKFGECHYFWWRIVEPTSIAKILFPPLIFTSLLTSKFVKPEDFRLLPFQYINLLFSRIKLWKESAKERVFLV